MSSLQILRCGANRDRFALTRRSHELDGVEHEHVAHLTPEAATALADGGHVRIALRDELVVDGAPWRLEVLKSGAALQACYIGDTALEALLREPDTIHFAFENRELAYLERSEMALREKIEHLGQALEQAREDATRLQARIAAHRREHGIDAVPATDQPDQPELFSL